MAEEPPLSSPFSQQMTEDNVRADKFITPDSYTSGVLHRGQGGSCSRLLPQQPLSPFDPGVDKFPCLVHLICCLLSLAKSFSFFVKHPSSGSDAVMSTVSPSRCLPLASLYLSVHSLTICTHVCSYS